MSASGLYVGTSGWAYKEWIPSLYPPGVPQSRYLEHYARELNACEINATFYRAQSLQAVGRWAEATPSGFRFAAKSHRAITHSGASAPTARLRALLEDWLGSLDPLGARLGVVLVQVPAHKTSGDDQMMQLLTQLGDRIPFAVDFRHESWHTDEIARAVAAAGGTMCHSDYDGDAPDHLPPGPVGYVRLRSDAYDLTRRARWLELARRAATERPVFLFAKHKGIEPDDPRGGLGLARWVERARRSGSPTPHGDAPQEAE